MKRILLLFVFASFFANAQNWKAHPKKPYSPTDSCLVWQDSTKKFYRIKCSEISGSATVDSIKVGRIEQGRGTAPIFMYFNGVAWVRNDTSYVPKNTNILNVNNSFSVGLSGYDNALSMFRNNYTALVSKNITPLGGQSNVVVSSLDSGYIQLGIVPSNVSYSRLFSIKGTNYTYPTKSFEFTNGLAHYNGDYRTYMIDDETIPDIGKVKQLISDSIGTVQSTTLPDGKIWIGDGTNTAFPRALSGAITVDNLGVTSYNEIVSSTKGGAGTINGALKSNGSGVVSAADSSSIYNAIGSKPANKVLLSPDGTTGNISARYLKRRDLKNTLTTIGTVASDDYSVDYLATRYTQVGSSIWTVSVGKLNAAGGSTKTLGNYVGYSYYGKINSKKETISIDITVGTLSSTSFGIGIGLQGTALAVQGAILLDNVNTGRLAFYFNNSTATEDISDGALSLSAGDVVNLRYTLLQNSLILVATNTTLGTKPSITYTKELINNNSTTYRTPNAGFATIYSLGGSHSVDNFLVVNNASKYPRILFIDDSKGAGSHQSNEGQSYSSFLARKINGQVEYLAGGGNYVADNNATEALAYEADLIFIASGTNDVLRGDAAATIMASYATLEGNLTGYTRGTNLFYVNLPPNNTVSTVTLNASMSTTFGDNVCKIYSTFVTNGATTIQAKYTNDGTHLNGEGKRIQAEIIYDYGIRKGLWQTGENANMGGNEVHSNGNNTALGGMNHIPQTAAHIYTYNDANQFAISPTYNSNDGLGMWSTSSGHAVLSAGCNTFTSGTITNTHTSAMRLSMLNGDYKISSDAGLSIGATLTPTNRLQYTNSSNVWEQLNSYAIFGGNNATTNGSTIFRQTNAGADVNALVQFSNGITTGAGATSSGIGVGGGFQGYIGNGTRLILGSAISFGVASSTAGSEAGYISLSYKPSTGALTDGLRLIENGNIGIGTTSPTAKLHVEGTVVIKSYTVATLPTCAAGVYQRATVTDALTPAYDVTVVGGGARVIEVICNGTNWVCH